MIARFAPSLTGYLHLGHVLHMIYVWGIAQSRSAKVICRIEDHDLGRARPEYESAILENMEWLGFVPDLGLTADYADEPSEYRQSNCSNHYSAVLESLKERGLVYGCECSRKEILESMVGGTPSSAPVDSGGAVSPVQHNELCYSGTCSEKGLPLEGNAVRLRIPEGEVVFQDLKLGECQQTPPLQCGDFALRDRTGQWSYQFCCVCDDIRLGVDLVIRGEDILASTGRQIQLFQTLGHSVPQFFHHPLLHGADGRKLSKRQRSESITGLREAGATADEILGKALFAGGMISEEVPTPLNRALEVIASA